METLRKMQILRYYWLTPLEKCKLCDFVKSMFLQTSSVSRTSPKTFIRTIVTEKKEYKRFNFLTKTVD